jgi:hypothetical protein
MAQFIGTLGNSLRKANISSDMEALADLECAVSGDLACINGVLNCVEQRITKELTARNSAIELQQ